MANIRVRVGQRNAVKVVSSNKAGAFSIAAGTDVNSDARADHTVLMFDSASGKYVHVTPADIADLIDGVDDDEVDFGEW